jgi:hypothetical protein
MKRIIPTRPDREPASLGIIETLRGRKSCETYAATALAFSTLPEQTELLTLLIRCRTFDEVKLLAFAFGLRAGADGAQVVLVNRKGTVAAQAWLFD